MKLRVKHLGKTKTIIDEIDIEILSLLENNTFRITDLQKNINLTHANLNTHLKRLSPFIKRNRDKQTINLSLTQRGKNLISLIEETDGIL